MQTELPRCLLHSLPTHSVLPSALSLHAKSAQRQWRGIHLHKSSWQLSHMCSVLPAPSFLLQWVHTLPRQPGTSRPAVQLA
jgi:hypothetical protein